MLIGQKNSRSLSLEKLDSAEFKTKFSSYKKSISLQENPIENKKLALDSQKKVSAFELTSRRERKKINIKSIDTIKSNPSEIQVKRDTANLQVDLSKDTTKEIKPVMTIPQIIPNPQYSDVNAAYKAELDRKNAEFEAANAKAAAIADRVAYYKKLREKFDEEAREKRIKDSLSAIESARKAAQAFDARHLKPDQAPQFEKHRNGYVDVPEKKKTAEEEYNELFK